MDDTSEVLIGAIRACKSRSQLEDVFEKFGTSGNKLRFKILMKAMYDPQFFFSCEDPDSDLRYELAVEMFLTMNWKVSALYEK